MSACFSCADSRCSSTLSSARYISSYWNDDLCVYFELLSQKFTSLLWTWRPNADFSNILFHATYTRRCFSPHPHQRRDWTQHWLIMVSSFDSLCRKDSCVLCDDMERVTWPVTRAAHEDTGHVIRFLLARGKWKYQFNCSSLPAPNWRKQSWGAPGSSH